MKTSTTKTGLTEWHLRRAELAAILAHTSQDSTCESLYCVQLDVGTGRILATDGHRAIVVTAGERVDHDRAICARHIVPRTFLERAIKVCGRKDTILLRADGADCFAQIGDKEIMDRCAADRVSPPDIDRVMPQFDVTPCVEAGFNAAYLADLESIRAACVPFVRPNANGKGTYKYSPACTIRLGASDCDPMTAEFLDAEATRWRVAIMPMRR